MWYDQGPSWDRESLQCLVGWSPVASKSSVASAASDFHWPPRPTRNSYCTSRPHSAYSLAPWWDLVVFLRRLLVQVNFGWVGWFLSLWSSVASGTTACSDLVSPGDWELPVSIYNRVIFYFNIFLLTLIDLLHVPHVNLILFIPLPFNLIDP